MRVVGPTRKRQAQRRRGIAGRRGGELITSLESDEAFAGYRAGLTPTRASIRDGWYFTGDLGYRDADGDYWVTGRVDDMIITGGENVYPIEVEDVLARSPRRGRGRGRRAGGREVGPGRHRLRRPRHAGPTAAELDAHCRASVDLAAFKRPKRVVFVRGLPKSPVGKLLRRLLVAGEYDTV